MDKPGIRMTKVWSDDDVVELEVRVCDGKSLFANRVYVGHSALAEAVADLRVFNDYIHGGLLDVRFGEFGPEYGNGAFHGRFQFPRPGALYVTCRQESEYDDFAAKNVASEATLYVKSEPALLDRFIGELGAMSAGNGDEAQLEGI